MFYASTDVNPEKFQGLAPRFSTTVGTPLGSSQIVKADASPSGSDQTSIWLVGWGEDGVSGLFPKGSKAGIDAKDLGEILVPDGLGQSAEYLAQVTDWKWKAGLMVKDFTRVARVCNIDTSALIAGTSTNNIVPAMIKAFHKVNTRGVKPVWYANKTIGTYLHLQALEAVKNSTLTIEKIDGKPVTHFLGFPIIETDGILDNEGIVG